MEKQFSNILGQLKFDDEVLEWTRAALLSSHKDERVEHETAIKRLEAEYSRLQSRMDAMYIDKLDGRITSDFFERMAAQWRDEESRCLMDIEAHQNANHNYMEDGLKLLELAKNAQALFERQPAKEKCRLLNILLSNCYWQDGELVAEFRQPFNLLAKTQVEARTKIAEKGPKSPE